MGNVKPVRLHNGTEVLAQISGTDILLIESGNITNGSIILKLGEIGPKRDKWVCTSQGQTQFTMTYSIVGDPICLIINHVPQFEGWSVLGNVLTIDSGCDIDDTIALSYFRLQNA